MKTNKPVNNTEPAKTGLVFSKRPKILAPVSEKIIPRITAAIFKNRVLIKFLVSLLSILFSMLYIIFILPFLNPPQGEIYLFFIDCFAMLAMTILAI